jgi:hypothetical protein
MGAHVHGHRRFGNVHLFRGHKTYWDCHRDALFSSSIQAHLTKLSLRPLLPEVHVSPCFSRIDRTRLLSPPLFLVHGLVRLRQEFAKGNGALGAEPRRANAEG